MSLGQFTEPKLLVPNLLSEWRDGVIAGLSQRLESTQRIESDTEFTHDVLDHESLVSTVFDDVAFPLARGRAVKELSFALGLSQHGVRWGTGRTPVVHTVVLLAVPLSEAQDYHSLVLTMFSFLRDEMTVFTLRQCSQPEEMWAVLNKVRRARTSPGAA
jgi:mannitol/fructose-specific phosphotransferase system IIA component (Ntr-type)